MSVNDPISDMLTRIRNAGMARQVGDDDAVDEGPGGDREDPEGRGLHRGLPGHREAAAESTRRSRCATAPTSKPAIREIKRVSKPGLRVYAGKDDIPARAERPRDRRSSAPRKGVMTGYEARRRGIGGEVLCTVF